MAYKTIVKMKVVHSSLLLFSTMPCSRGPRISRRFSQSHRHSRNNSRSRSSKSLLRSQSEKPSARQSLSPSSALDLQKIPSAMLLDRNESSLDLICLVCLKSLGNKTSRSKSMTRKRSTSKKLIPKAVKRQRSKTRRKSHRAKKRSVKKSHRKAALIKSTKFQRSGSSLKSTQERRDMQ
ncbi:hypothetical protein T4B_4280 [Trichinella pseudospiralis]|uniref:Uncharacterized protein n=2 Tax=Trichinella pseudospiralis TaxID=6337 RepID=A0A0V1JLL2_TRIPS|nr:hypothetical protein T4B_4280 [Trichinella pseudospiralis]KRZ35831.1 hypothetical protein T4C_11780 [Trichinella pseudospiralis]